MSDGRRLVVRTDGAAFEPVTGQMVLDFRVDEVRNDVAWAGTVFWPMMSGDPEAGGTTACASVSICTPLLAVSTV